MKSLLLILMLMFSVGTVSSQRLEVMLIPFELDGKWGYVDYYDSIIVAPIFEEAYPTFDLRGRIRQNGKYGFINEKGQIVIKPKYDQAEDFNFGISKVSKRGEVKIIKTNGKENKQNIAICGSIYRNCLQTRSFTGIDTFKQENRYYVTISRANREDGITNYYPDTLKTTFDVVSTLGRQYVILENQGKKALFFDQGEYHSTKYVDSTLNFKYDDFKFFACQGDEFQPHEVFGFKVNDKWGYIRLFYVVEEIIEPLYLTINSMERGIALVEYEKGKFGYVNQHGKEYFKRY